MANQTTDKQGVWVLTCGKYSDYQLVGLFSTEQLAREYKEAFKDKWRDYHEPREMFLDPGDTSFYKEGRKPYGLYMDRDGNSSDIEERWGADCTEGEYRLYLYTDYPNCNETMLDFTCWATDKEHAVKIANEVRVQLIAEDKWIAEDKCQ